MKPVLIDGCLGGIIGIVGLVMFGVGRHHMGWRWAGSLTVVLGGANALTGVFFVFLENLPKETAAKAALRQEVEEAKQKIEEVLEAKHQYAQSGNHEEDEERQAGLDMQYISAKNALFNLVAKARDQQDYALAYSILESFQAYDARSSGTSS